MNKDKDTETYIEIEGQKVLKTVLPLGTPKSLQNQRQLTARLRKGFKISKKGHRKRGCRK